MPFWGGTGLLSEQAFGQQYRQNKQTPVSSELTADHVRKFILPGRIVLACVVMVGIHYLKTIVQGTSQVPNGSTWPSTEQRQHPAGNVDTCIHVMSGDRLIVSSLDQGALLHEVQISWATESSPSSRIRGPGSELPSIDVVTINGGITRRAAAQDLTIRAESHQVAAMERLAAAPNEPPTRIPKTQTPLLSRCFRLPRFTTLSDPDLRSAAAAQQFIDNIVVCRQRAASDRVSLYASDVELSVASIQELLETAQKLSTWNLIHGPCGIADVDGDNRLSIVVCVLSDGKTNTENPLLGCVRANDFLEDDSLGGDIIYLDYRLLGTPALTAVLTHEIAHAAVFSRIRFWRDKGHVACLLPAWLNESIAHSCEFRRCPQSTNLSDRISTYLSNTGRWPLMPNQQGFNAVSARGPVRAAGLFYMEFLRQSQTLDALIDAELRDGTQQPEAADAEFAELFRDWTVWMSERQQTGEVPLEIRPLPESESKRRVTIRGTAATWWQADRAGVVKVSTHARCKLQLTVVRSPTVDAVVINPGCLMPCLGKTPAELLGLSCNGTGSSEGASPLDRIRQIPFSRSLN